MKKKTSMLATVKKIGVVSLVIFLSISLLAGAFSSLFRVKTGISNFDEKFAMVTPSTRKALRDELQKTTLLNTGKEGARAKFRLREDSAELVENSDTREWYGSMYIDSDVLQLSLFVQMNWGGSFSDTNESYIVRIECASLEQQNYASKNCISPIDNEKYFGFEQENLRLLDNGQENFEQLYESVLRYFKEISPNAKSLLVQRDSINVSDGVTEAQIKLNGQEKYQIKISNNTLSVSKNNAELWSYNAIKNNTPTHHYLLIENHLPVELSTENGTDFSLRLAGDKKLKIRPDCCKDGDNDDALIEQARTWLESQHFSSSDFEISLQKSCSR